MTDDGTGANGDGTGEGTAPVAAEVACFEAGIKFGSLYHQFAGTPVAPRSAASLSAAMEEAIENQPHCEAVRVRVDPDRVRDAIDGPEGYTELTGTLMDVDLRVVYEGIEVRAEMRTEDGYPRMRVASVGRPG
jgi:hypothetical protein